jgi:hypothetical protein
VKAKVIRTDLEVSPSDSHLVGDDIAHWLPVYRNHSQTVARFFKEGAIIEHPKAFRLVQEGCAVPADEECRQECRVRGMTDARMAAAQHAYERLKRNVPPEKFGLYDAGFISGWEYPDGGPEEGQPIPGPKWDEYQEMLAKQAQDEVDDE